MTITITMTMTMTMTNVLLMHTVVQLNIHYNMVYARKLYLITSTNLYPETVIEAKITRESIIIAT